MLAQGGANRMEVVLLEGVLMNNGKFICHGKSIDLTKEEITKYIRTKD